MTVIAASLLSADFAELKNEIRSVEQGGVDWLHLDVMDGHFVPNITFGPFITAAIRKITQLPLDAHLMITDPLKYAPEFAKAGADYITIHAETVDDPKTAIQNIKTLGVKAGLSVNPGTPLDKVLSVIGDIDLFLVMSVHPGFGGQKFMPEVLDKVRTLKKLKDQGRTKALISIDGGINRQTAARAVEAGAEVLVAGAAIFGAADRKMEIEAIRAGKVVNGR
jgi:ribulose-phosphate 3-epimerase